jgi:hypothetical protein
MTINTIIETEDEQTKSPSPKKKAVFKKFDATKILKVSKTEQEL